MPPPGYKFFLVSATLLGCLLRLPVDRPAISIRLPAIVLVACVAYVGVLQLPQMLAGYPGREDHVGFVFFQLLTAAGTLLAVAYLAAGRSPTPMLVAILAGATLAGAVAALGYFGLGRPLVEGLSALPPVERVRATGPFLNSNYFGSLCAASFVLAVAAMSFARSSAARLALWLALLVIGLGMLVSFSRTAILATLVGIAFLVYVRSRALAAVLVLAGVVAAVVVYPAFAEWRVATSFGEPSAAGYASWAESDEYRLSALLAAPAILLTEPVFGVGLGQYAWVSSAVGGRSIAFEAHNWYAGVLAEQGLVGFSLWVLLGVTVVIELRKLHASPVRALGFGVLGCLLASGMFLEPPTSFQAFAAPSVAIAVALAADWTPRSLATTSPGTKTVDPRPAAMSGSIG